MAKTEVDKILDILDSIPWQSEWVVPVGLSTWNKIHDHINANNMPKKPKPKPKPKPKGWGY